MCLFASSLLKLVWTLWGVLKCCMMVFGGLCVMIFLEVTMLMLCAEHWGMIDHFVSHRPQGWELEVVSITIWMTYDNASTLYLVCI